MNALLVLLAVGTDPVRYPDALAHRPTPLPGRVILTWKGPPTTTQAVTWRTDASIPTGVGQVAVSESGPGFDPLDPKKPGTYRAVPAVTTPLTTDLGPAHYHTVNFDGLTPATTYVYRVGDGVNWTEWSQFETASDRPEPFGFVYLGDAQNDIKRHWSRVVRGAYSDMPKARFVIHAGDLVNRGPSDAEWGEWHAAAGWINGRVPSVPTPGNHEYIGPPRPLTDAVAGGPAVAVDRPRPATLTAHWRPQFALPENGPQGLEETVYWFDFQGVRVVSLNSNERVDEQVTWLDAVLADNLNRWTVVTFHHPIYSTAKGRDNKRLRELWRPVFDRHGVDLVLQGHDHSYGRSGLMREDNVLAGRSARDRGTVYVVSVSGPKMYGLDRQAWMRADAQDTQLYQLVRIDGDRLLYESRTAAGDVYDAFALRKHDGYGNDLVEGSRYDPAARPGGRDAVAAVAGMGVLAGGYAVVRAVRRPPSRRSRNPSPGPSPRKGGEQESGPVSGSPSLPGKGAGGLGHAPTPV